MRSAASIWIVRLRDRKLDRLVLADRTVEHDALFGIRRRGADEPARRCRSPLPPSARARRSCRRGCSGNPLPSSPIERCPPALSRSSKKTSRRVMVHHHARVGLISRPLPSDSRMSMRKVEMPWERLFTSPGGVVRASTSMKSECCAREVKIFWPFERVAAARPDRARLELRRVGAGGRLGHAESLQPQLACRDLRKVLALLRFTSVSQDGAHRIHLRVTRRSVAARRCTLPRESRLRRAVAIPCRLYSSGINAPRSRHARAHR